MKFPSLFLIFLCAISFLRTPAYAVENRNADQGTVDISGWNGESLLRLKGQWYFFMNEIIEPQDLLRRLADPGFKPAFTQIGQSFPEAAGERVSNFGYATYVLRVKGWPANEIMGFIGIQAYTSARVYFFGADGRGSNAPVQTIGRVGMDVREAAPQISATEVQALPPGGEQDHYFLIQVSNFQHSWGGLWNPPEVASLSTLNRYWTLKESVSFFVIGALFFAVVYNFSLFSRRPEDKGSLILGFLALQLAMRSLLPSLMGDTLFGSHQLAYQVTLKTTYVSMMLTPTLALMFFYCYFPRQVPKRVVQVLIVTLSLLACFFIVAPSRIFTLLGTAAQFIGLGTGVICSICLVRATLAKERGALLVTSGALVVLLGGGLDVLSTKGQIQLPVACMSIGLMIFIMAQSQIVGVFFAVAFRKAEHLSRELKNEVDRQTRDIKSILINIHQGIFTVSGPEQLIDEQYSQHLHEILGIDHIAGQSLSKCLWDLSSLTSDDKAQVYSSLDAALGEDELNFEVNQSLLVKEIRYRNPKYPEDRILELDWSAVLNTEGIVEKVLVSVRDVSELRELEQRNREQEEDLKVIVELVQIPEDRFHRFVLKTMEFLSENRLLIAEGGESKPDVIKKLFVNMHTIKGAARTYLLRAISSTTHEVEQYYSEILKKKALWDSERLLKDLEKVESTLAMYKNVGESRLGWELEEKSVKIKRSKIEFALDMLSTLDRNTLPAEQRFSLHEAEDVLIKSCYVELPTVVEEACHGLDSMARDLQKDMPILDVKAPPVVLKDVAADVLHSILSHLLRNSLDHGLEKPEERLAKGKSRQGTLFFHSEVRAGELTIKFSDDGNGINLEKLKKVALENNLLSNDKELDDLDLANLIFQSGLSTKDSVSEISGRGVGLDAVKRYLESIGGGIELHLASPVDRQHVPFHFSVRLPGKYFFMREFVSEDKAA